MEGDRGSLKRTKLGIVMESNTSQHTNTSRLEAAAWLAFRAAPRQWLAAADLFRDSKLATLTSWQRWLKRWADQRLVERWTATREHRYRTRIEPLTEGAAQLARTLELAAEVLNLEKEEVQP
jgi:hypothetical protein